jgi:RNA polymerase sigma-70 factor (ECF subfamily)
MERAATLGEQFATVLDGARAGEDWAWARIYDSLAPALAGYLRTRGAPDPDAVCGEVFYHLVRDIGRFDGDEQGFRSWVFVMAHHRLLDDLRRRSRRPETPAGMAEFHSVVEWRDVEGEVVGRTHERELHSVLDELTPAQRDVLLLRFLGELSVEEVAEAIGRRPGAVKGLQRRGLQALRAKLEARGYLAEAEGR